MILKSDIPFVNGTTICASEGLVGAITQYFNILGNSAFVFYLSPRTLAYVFKQAWDELVRMYEDWHKNQLWY